MGDIREKCIVTERIPHDDKACLMTPNEMSENGVNEDMTLNNCNKFSMDCTLEAASIATRYAQALSSNLKDILKPRCKNVLGNRYIKKSETKCNQVIKEDGVLYKDNIDDYYIHTYMDTTAAMCDNPNPGSVEYSGCQAANIFGGSTGDITSYFSNEKKCIEVDLPCHIIYFDKEESEDITEKTIRKVPIDINQFNTLRNKGFEQKNLLTISDAQKDYLRSQDSNDNFTNLHESINTYLQNNPELLPSNMNNMNNMNNIDNKDNIDNDMLFDLYYLLMSGFLLFILFKLINKK